MIAVSGKNDCRCSHLAHNCSCLRRLDRSYRCNLKGALFLFTFVNNHVELTTQGQCNAGSNPDPRDQVHHPECTSPTYGSGRRM